MSSSKNMNDFHYIILFTILLIILVVAALIRSLPKLGYPLLFLLILVIIYLIVVIEIHRYVYISSRWGLEAADQNYQSLPRVNSSYRVVISLTTIPDRIALTKPTFISLLKQKQRVDEIAINVPYVSMKGDEYIIPEWLESLENVKIYRMEKDVGPATKILPTLKREDENTRIIIVDDDVIYHPDVIKNLVNAFEEHNGEHVFTNFGLSVSCNNNKLALSSKSERFMNVFKSRKQVDIVQGVTGFILIPRMLPVQVHDFSIAPSEAITVDDVWISGWLAHNKIKVFTVGYYILNPVLPQTDGMIETTSLLGGVNSGFTRDAIAIQWFNKNYNVFNNC